MDAEYHRLKGKEHYRKYKQQYLDRQKVVRARNYAIMDEARKDGCVRCDEHDLCCLDFHHADGGKELNVSALVNCSEKRLRAEIAKCTILCANCHRKEHGSDRHKQ
jgi:hypothetical protein